MLNMNKLAIDIPEERPAPSMAQWRELYGMAVEIRNEKPWQLLYDSDYIGVQPVNYEEPVFFSTMGRAGTCEAVAAFRGYEALSLLEMLRVPSIAEAPFSAIGYQRCATCYFGDRDELHAEERKMIADLGFKFRGKGQWIFFRSLKPGYMPWRINDAEAEMLIDTMRQYLEAYRAIKSGAFPMKLGGEMAVIRRQVADGMEWVHEATTISTDIMIAKTLVKDDLFLARLKKKKKMSYEVAFDSLYLPMPVQEDKEVRPRSPKIFLMIDIKSGMILGQRMVFPGDDIEQTALGMFEDLVSERGRPRIIHIRDELMEALLADFCEKMDIELEVGGYAPGMNEIWMSMFEHFGLLDEE